MSAEEEASRQCTHEMKALIHRWSEESDLCDQDIINCLVEAATEYWDEDVIEFEDDGILDGGLDLGETEEGG